MKLKNIFSALFGPSRAQLEQKVAALIADGKIPEAMQALLDAGHTEAALLKAQWDSLMLRQQTEPKLDWETFSITQNRITYALLKLTKPKSVGGRQSAVSSSNPEQAKGIEHGAKLNLDDEGSREGIENPELPVLTEGQHNQLRQLLEQDQWVQALELGKDWSNELMLTYGRYQSLERDYRLGMITEETYQITRSRILNALRHFVDSKDNE